MLPEKLDYYGTRRVSKDLLRSYLVNRKQNVKLSGSNSSIKPILTCFPKGSNLRQLLFFVYINDLFKCVNYSETSHSIDGINMLQSRTSLKTLVKRMNLDLKNLSQMAQSQQVVP